MKDTNEKTDTFENIYPKYPFSELVRLSLKLTGCLVALRRNAGRTKAARTRNFSKIQTD